MTARLQATVSSQQSNTLDPPAAPVVETVGAVKEGEAKPSRELAALLENHLEDVPSLSPRKPSTRHAIAVPPSPPPPPMQPATDEHDKQCQRELRTFLRVALSELLKEKRCSVFARPVDPENVPDYYDVVTCPMDLGNTRTSPIN